MEDDLDNQIYIRDGFYLHEEVKNYLNPPSTDCLNSIQILDHKILKKTFSSGVFKLIELQVVKIHDPVFLKTILDEHFKGKRKSDKIYENNIIVFKMKKDSSKKDSPKNTPKSSSSSSSSNRVKTEIFYVCKEITKATALTAAIRKPLPSSKQKKKPEDPFSKLKKFCREKAGYLLEEKDAIVDPSKYFYIEPRKFYNNDSFKEAEYSNGTVDQGAFEFIQTISSLKTVIAYIQKNDLKDDFLFHKFPIETIQKLRQILNRLNDILTNPTINKKYVIENSTDPLFRELLKEGTGKELHLTDEKEELSLIFYSLSPYKENKTKIKTIETFEEIAELHAFLDELEDIEKNFFVKTSSKTEKFFYSGTHIAGISTLDRTKGKVLYDYAFNSWGYNHISYDRGRAKIKNILEISYTKPKNDRIFFTPDAASGQKNNNRFYLFHGSPLINWKSIILNGLSLPSHRGMFGKGIYFASSIGKSFGYVYDRSGVSPDDSIKKKKYAIGIFEVNLGNMKQLTIGCSTIDRKSLERQYDSVWGVGSNSILETIDYEGVKVPIVETQNKKVSSNLIHDEYIIYEKQFAVLKYVVFLEDR